nr:MAG TPA: hypothetical protein [Caudoviricetes sp.]
MPAVTYSAIFLLLLFPSSCRKRGNEAGCKYICIAWLEESVRLMQQIGIVCEFEHAHFGLIHSGKMFYKFLFQIVNRFHKFSPFKKIQRQGYCPAALL